MTFSVNGIYDYICKSVHAYNSDAYVTSRREPVPKAMPCVQIQQLNKMRPTNAMTLDLNDRQYLSTFEAQIYSNSKDSALSEAYGLEEVVESAFNELGYRVTFCQPIDNYDPAIYRLVARYERVIGVGDMLPDYPST